MDFGAILDKWENQTPDNKTYDKDAAALKDGSSGYSRSGGQKISPGERRSWLLRKKPDAFIDLHGLTKDEAWTSLESFFQNSRSSGFEKVQIIHGKGNHVSSGASALLCDEAALRDLSRRFIERCSFAGESGHCTSREGGTGATWVILKR